VDQFPAHQARKRFGQNFLTDTSVIDRIVRSINPQPSDHLIEIGPGLGAITQHLLSACPRMIAVELDRDLSARLQHQFPSLHLLEGDALKTDFAQLISGNGVTKVVGNLPYNISTPLIFHLLSYGNIIHEMYFMLQSEVVDRMASPPGSKTYGRLSVMVQHSCSVEPLFEIPPHAFNPQPKVTSTFVAIKPHKNPAPLQDSALFERLVNLSFQQRRKTLRNALHSVLPQTLSTTIECQLSRRAEQLSVTEFVELANHLNQAKYR